MTDNRQTPRHDPPQDMLADLVNAVWGQPRQTDAEARAEMARERMDERAFEERVG